MTTTDCLVYRWQKGLSRYYKVYLYKDLLGDWVLTKVWGGMGKNSKRGNYKKHVCHDLSSAFLVINETLKRRKNHGYKLL